MSASLKLLTAATATGASVDVTVPGDYVFSVVGTFGGATVGIQMLGPNGITWITLNDASGAISFSDAGAIGLTLPIGSYRATIVGGSGVSIHAKLARAM